MLSSRERLSFLHWLVPTYNDQEYTYSDYVDMLLPASLSLHCFEPFASPILNNHYKLIVVNCQGFCSRLYLGDI